MANNGNAGLAAGAGGVTPVLAMVLGATPPILLAVGGFVALCGVGYWFYCAASSRKDKAHAKIGVFEVNGEKDD